MMTEESGQLLTALTTGGHFQLMSSLSDVCHEMLGHQLLSLSKIETAENRVCRIYTTDQEHYPIGGYKPIPQNQWTEKVINKQQSFLATNIDEISRVFFDYELIESLGLGSAINVPIICFGEVLGTVNLLHRTNFYDQRSAQKIQQLMPWFVITMTGSFHQGKYIGDKCQ